MGQLFVEGREVHYFGPADWTRPGMLTFAETPAYRALCDKDAIVLAGREQFYDLFLEAVRGPWEPLATPDRLGIGGDAFKVVRGQRCPCVGGVWIDPSATLGSFTAVDRGIWGEFTEIGADTHLDNLVHVGHSALLGRGVTVVAGTVIGGWAVLGDGCWIGENVSIRDNVTIGAHALVGMGSVVLGNVPAHALVFGNPAKQKGWVCSCRKTLKWEGDMAPCSCGKWWLKSASGVEAVQP